MPDKRNINLSLIRIIACLAVVLLHTANLAMAYFGPASTTRIITASMRNLMLWSVPCFVMVTGALLLDPAKDITYKKLFGKYIKRILIVLVLFTIIYKITDIAISGTPLSTSLITEYLSDLVFGTSWSHVWYLYLILAIYLLLPFYRMVAAKAGAKDLRYLLVVLIVFQSLLTLVSDITGKETAFYICISTVFPLFLFAGYAIDRGVIKIHRALAIAVILLGIAAIIILSMEATKLQSEILGSMVTSYHFIATVLMSIAIFSLISGIKISDRLNSPVFRSLDSCTFGIYLIHMIVLNLIYKVIGFNPLTLGVYMLPVIAIVTFIISWGITFLLKLIPGIKKIL